MKLNLPCPPLDWAFDLRLSAMIVHYQLSCVHVSSTLYSGRVREKQMKKLYYCSHGAVLLYHFLFDIKNWILPHHHRYSLTRHRYGLTWHHPLPLFYFVRYNYFVAETFFCPVLNIIKPTGSRRSIACISAFGFIYFSPCSSEGPIWAYRLSWMLSE